MGKIFTRVLRAISVMVAIMLGGQTVARADTAPAYVVTYIEVGHGAVDKVAALLKTWAKTTRRSDGNLGIVALQNTGLKNQFALVETWRDEAAFQNHATSPEAKAYREALSPLLIAPYDERPHTTLAVDQAGLQATMTATPAHAVFVVTHADIIPPKRDEGVNATASLAAPARLERGNLAFDVFLQASRPNHMTLFEVWTSKAADDAHQEQASLLAYRTTLLSMSGSLYDQRFYQRID